MKKPYDTLDLDVVRFGAEDVLATSGGECAIVDGICKEMDADCDGDGGECECVGD